MPRLKLTKSAIDALPTPQTDTVYWDAALPGFGIKVTPKGRKVFIVLYRTGGGGSKLRKYTIGPYGRVTLHRLGWPRRRYSPPDWMAAIWLLRNGRRIAGSWRIALRIYWRPSSTNISRKTAPGVRLLGCFAGRSERPGSAEVSMR